MSLVAFLSSRNLAGQPYFIDEEIGMWKCLLTLPGPKFKPSSDLQFCCLSIAPHGLLRKMASPCPPCPRKMSFAYFLWTGK